VKANPFSAVVKLGGDLGLGAECASIVEVMQATRQLIDPEDIIYDSPAKTIGEIDMALNKGILINLDNEIELKKVQRCLQDSGWSTRNDAVPRIGLRINPQMEAGTISVTSTATKTSKFGLPLRDEPGHVKDLFLANPFLNTLHIHTGSQGCPMDLSAKGIKIATDLALEVNREANRRQIQHLDIGGGVPGDYDEDGEKGGGSLYRFSEYREAIDSLAPHLWSEGFRIYTEMGRSLTCKMGWTAARVEAVKDVGGRRIAVCHVGADLFPRTAYQPHNWPHRISIMTKDGDPKEGKVMKQDVAGPLCFSGDLLATERLLPCIEDGDIVVVHDTGAYTYSMHSRYNSRLGPAVYGYDGVSEGGNCRFTVVKAAEKPQDVWQFWDSPSYAEVTDS